MSSRCPLNGITCANTHYGEAFDDLAGLPLSVKLSVALLTICPLQFFALLYTTSCDVPEVHSHKWYGMLTARVGHSLLSEPFLGCTRCTMNGMARV